MIFEPLALPFFSKALLAGLLASLACGIIGTYVVVKRISSISGGLAHAAFGGVGLGYFLGFSPMLGATGFGILSSIVIGVFYLRQHHSLDTLIAMVWAVGMALGVIFIALTPGYAPDLTSYLFGSILFVPSGYIFIVGILDLVILTLVVFFFKHLQAVAFDEEYAEVAGIPVPQMFLMLLVLTSLAVVTLIRVVGVILTIALLSMPAAIARQWTDSLKRMMVAATGIAAFCTTFGLFLSYWMSSWFALNMPTGPLIIIIAACCYGISSIASAVVNRNH